MKYPPDKFQQPILDSIASGNPNNNLFINAVAGSGKSTTLEMVCEELKKQKLRVLLLAFNSHIAKAASDKIKGVDIMTSHARGSRALQKVKRTKSPDIWKYANICDEIAQEKWSKQSDRFKARRELRDIASFCFLSGVDVSDPAKISECIDTYGLDCFDPALIDLVPEVKSEGLRSFNKYGEVDFMDQIWLPIELGIEFDKYDVVLADESQDFNMLQILISSKSIAPKGSGLWVADPFQCQPPETMVTMKFGESKKISQLKIGDKVISFIPREGRYGTGTVTGVANHIIDDVMLTVKWNNRETKCTKNHKFFIRWSEDHYSDYCVYLMKSGDKFRIGKTKLFQKTGDFGPTGRMRTEKADAIWILGVFKTEREALTEEIKLSVKYSIPTITFQEGIYGQNHKFNIVLNQEAINSIFNFIGSLEDQAINLLNSKGMDITLPFAERGSFKKMGKNVTFISYACNMIAGVHSLPLVQTMIVSSSGERKMFGEERYQKYKAIKEITTEYYLGEVWSINVDRETYIADGIPTHNSMYGFAAALPDSCDKIIQMNNCKEMPLSYCYRCPTSHLDRARKIVPHIENAPNAKEGEFIVRQRKKLSNLVNPDSMILCRFTAPLISACIELVTQRKPAYVIGQEIHKGLERIIDATSDQEGFKLVNFSEHLGFEKEEELERLRKRKNSESKAAATEDKFSAIDTCFKQFKPSTIQEFKNDLKDLFSPKKGAITLSTIHRSKGLEFNDVFVLEDDKNSMPVSFPGAMEWEQQQESNIKYVAYTRSKQRLVKIVKDKGGDSVE